MVDQAKPEPCCGCGKVGPDVTFSPDPYASEVNHDESPVWECGECRQKSTDDI